MSFCSGKLSCIVYLVIVSPLFFSVLSSCNSCWWVLDQPSNLFSFLFLVSVYLIFASFLWECPSSFSTVYEINKISAIIFFIYKSFFSFLIYSFCIANCSYLDAISVSYVFENTNNIFSPFIHSYINSVPFFPPL